MFCFTVCQCQKDQDCGNVRYRCDGCKCVLGKCLNIPLFSTESRLDSLFITCLIQTNSLQQIQHGEQIVHHLKSNRIHYYLLF